MDRERFDALARLLATTGSRRATLGALLGASLLGQRPDLLAKPGKGKNQDRKRRKKRGHTGNDGGQNPDPAPEPCCGTQRCADPEHGSTRSECDFAGRSFVGQDLNGSIFRRINGIGANFDGHRQRRLGLRRSLPERSHLPRGPTRGEHLGRGVSGRGRLHGGGPGWRRGRPGWGAGVRHHHARWDRQ